MMTYAEARRLAEVLLTTERASPAPHRVEEFAHSMLVFEKYVLPHMDIEDTRVSILRAVLVVGPHFPTHLAAVQALVASWPTLATAIYQLVLDAFEVSEQDEAALDARSPGLARLGATRLFC